MRRAAEGEALIDAVARADASLRADGAGGALLDEGGVIVWGGPAGLRPASHHDATNVISSPSLVRDDEDGGVRWLRAAYVDAMVRWVRDPERYDATGIPEEP